MGQGAALVMLTSGAGGCDRSAQRGRTVMCSGRHFPRGCLPERVEDLPAEQLISERRVEAIDMSEGRAMSAKLLVDADVRRRAPHQHELGVVAV